MKATVIAVVAAVAGLLFGVAVTAWAQPAVKGTHFQCYRVLEATAFRPRAVRLADQFGRSEPRIVKTLVLCTPVRKNDEGIEDTRTHLVCYVIERGKAANARVRVTNQFGEQVLKVDGPSTLCVPSLKTVLKE